MRLEAHGLLGDDPLKPRDLRFHVLHAPNLGTLKASELLSPSVIGVRGDAVFAANLGSTNSGSAFCEDRGDLLIGEA